MAATAGNPIDPAIQSILSQGRAAGGAPYTPVGETGSPFIVGGGTPYTPNTTPIGGGMTMGSYGQWALPRPAGVSLGYVPTAQTIGSDANTIAARTLESYAPPPPPPPVVAARTQPRYTRNAAEFNRGGEKGSAGYSTSGGYAGGVGGAYGAGTVGGGTPGQGKGWGGVGGYGKGMGAGGKTSATGKGGLY